MKQTISQYDFVDGFTGSYKDCFSYDGKIALYDYLAELEDGCGEEVEFDPIALCCEFTEYESFGEIALEYDNIETMQDLQDHTQVIEFDGGIIVQNF